MTDQEKITSQHIVLWSFTEWLTDNGYAIQGPDGSVMDVDDVIAAYFGIDRTGLNTERMLATITLLGRTAAAYGRNTAVVSALSGIPPTELKQLGGVPED